MREGGLLAAFVLFGLVVFWPVAVAGTHTFLWSWDNPMQSYAWMHKVVRAWQAGEVPLWDFGVQSGTSFVGELQTGAFYPPSILWALAGGHVDQQALDRFLVVHFGLAAYFMAWFLRRAGTGLAGAVVGGLAYAFFGTVAQKAQGQMNIFLGMVWLPAAAASFWRALDERGRITTSLAPHAAGAFLALAVVAGHLAPFVHAVVVLVVLTFVACASGGPRDWLRGTVALAAVGILAVGLAAPQLLPTIEYLAGSYRWYGDAPPMRGLAAVSYDVFAWDQVLHPRQLGNVLAPTHGLADEASLYVGRTALVLALIGAATRSRLALGMAALALYAVLVALGGHTLMGWVAYHTPLVRQVREPVRMLLAYQFAMVTLAAIGTGVVVRRARGFGGVVGAAAGLGLVGLVAAEAIANRERVTAWTNAVHSPALSYVDNPVAAFLEPRAAAERRLHRVVNHDHTVLPPNAGDVWAFHTTRAHRATMWKPYYRYLERGWDPMAPSQALLGAKYVVAREPQPGATEVFRAGDAVVWERPDALPVFQFRDAGGSVEPAAIADVVWHHNWVECVVDAGRPTTLVFAQVWYPGWHVAVDGAPRPLAAVDAFMGVELSAGRRRVRFTYRPWTVRLGYALAGTCLLAALLVAWRRRTGLTGSRT